MTIDRQKIENLTRVELKQQIKGLRPSYKHGANAPSAKRACPEGAVARRLELIAF